MLFGLLRSPFRAIGVEERAGAHVDAFFEFEKPFFWADFAIAIERGRDRCVYVCLGAI